MNRARSTIQRACLRCATPITACMGAVLPGDFVRAWNGEIPWSQVREACGICVLMSLPASIVGDFCASFCGGPE